MKRTGLFLFFLLGFISFSVAQELRFKADKKIRIVQFTDVHYIYGDRRSDIALERINEVQDAEKPDLVILTGDIIFGKPAREGMLAVLGQIASRQIPFAVTFGNHDDEHGMSRQELYEMIRTIPYNMTGTVEDLSGVTNFILPVRSSDGSKVAALLYCLDSHAYSSLEGIEGYDYIKFDQIQWYRNRSMEYTRQNDGVPIPSLAFFHIPLPEYNQAAADETAILTGTRKEKACAPQLNSGLFASMKEMGDVMGTFVGHDHDCDYAVYWKDILLAYGRYTGGNTVYNNLSNGARVIELTEGERGFTSWIRLKGNEVINRIHYPSDFIKKKD